ncbi:glycosyltransferase family 2 protein [Enterocloster aldenensis]|uniref:glycosyltransferase family 2 protein n=1 Tax=Enterocloster aldenensis TaxID=358742 RepID=UPI000E4C828B|nr:glycosyltransferase family 2 protein [Enterocloster aldenensis]
MDVLAGIVLYNPSISRLKENIQAVYGQVDRILLVDNGSYNRDDISRLVNEIQDCNIHILFNENNMGIAYALNQILDYALLQSYKWFLTLDQDSICNKNLTRQYLRYINNEIGQISCNIIDRNVGRIEKKDSIIKKRVCEIPFCITSGCLNNTEAIAKCGGFNREMFIDGVDLDISCNLRIHGYKILRLDYNGLLHELGDCEKRKIFGVRIIITHHSPWRNYYMRRNIIFVARKYYKGLDKTKMIGKQILYACGTVVLEDKKYDRIKANIKGIWDGFKTNLS